VQLEKGMLLLSVVNVVKVLMMTQKPFSVRDVSRMKHGSVQGRLDLTDELYDHFVTSSKANFHWFCEKCEAEVLDPGLCSDKLFPAQLNDIHLKTDSVEQHLIDSLAGIEQRLLDKVSQMEAVLQKKASSSSSSTTVGSMPVGV